MRFDLFGKINFVLFFFDPHFIKNGVVFVYAKCIEELFHTEVLTYVPAFESSRKKEGHEPSNDVAAC
jgi:hypothetical protein